MNDPDALEQYCSAYYDKHGSYNDGFPCPSDKFCCQNKEGLKYCCSAVSSSASSLSSSLSPILINNIQRNKLFASSTLANYNEFNQQKLNYKTPVDGDSSGTVLFNSKSPAVGSIPMLLTK